MPSVSSTFFLGPLFKLRDGRYLTKEIFTARVRSALLVLRYDEASYAGHSFRIGAATTAAEQGVEDSVIKFGLSAVCESISSIISSNVLEIGVF